MDLILGILKLLLGLTFFLFGMSVMSADLGKMAGGKLENLLKNVTKHPVLALALGAGITIAMQSSSATTVMLVGLVNSGIMQVSQTLSVIFGANIGTTLTSWILSLSGIDANNNILLLMLKPENFSPVFAFIGILILLFSKDTKKKSVGTIFVGFALLMYGMVLMADAVSPLKEQPWFASAMANLSNPLLSLLIGTVFTALIQSSAASIGILQALSLTGDITFRMAIPMVMGQNIGTCATALLSCFGTNANARRVAVIHLSIKVIGMGITLSIYLAGDAVFNFAFSNMAVTPFTIALIHTIYNIAITLILAPFSKLLVKLANVLVKDDKKTVKEQIFKLDDLLLRSPSVAIRECDAYTVQMADLAQEALCNSIVLMHQYDEKTAELVLESEDKIDLLEDSLGTYLVKLSASALSRKDSQTISKMLHTIGDYERLGDHAVNLLKVSREIHQKEIVFSPQAQAELHTLSAAIEEILQLTCDAYRANDSILASAVEPLEQVIDRLTAQIKNNHISRLQSGTCTIELGFVLSDILNNYERISDHCSNIAVAIIELGHNSFDTHQYLNSVKYAETGDFSDRFKSFSEKYHL